MRFDFDDRGGLFSVGNAGYGNGACVEHWVELIRACFCR